MGAFCGRVAYDGTAYHGFQFQRGVPTIQSVLEDGLRQIAELEGRVAGSGRTDTGVHASGQVISIEVAWRHSAGALQEAWNAHLPPDIHLREMRTAPPGFHPRFDALTRTYTYTVMGYGADEEPRPRRSPLTDRYAMFEPAPLDLPAMNAAAALLVGEHDFAAFGWPTAGESTIRRLLHAMWTDADPAALVGDFPGRRYVFTVTANGFLRSMVRLLTGTLLDVGRGRRTVTSVGDALAAKSRRSMSRPAPAHGLVLERVDYPAALALW
ncbi:MAG: tRNA pseudouridine(38-40) synthase TruA [Litorilinea sp.]